MLINTGMAMRRVLCGSFKLLRNMRTFSLLILLLCFSIRFVAGIEVGGSLASMRIDGVNVATRGPIKPYSTDTINEKYVLIYFHVGKYVPVVKFAGINSVGVFAEVATNSLSENGPMITGPFSIVVPLNLEYRLGAGNRKKTKSAFGFGLGFGYQMNIISTDFSFENISGYEKIYFIPNATVSVCSME
jgi:hypothetical protein